MAKTCPNCGETDNIEVDAVKGESWCLTCASLIEKNALVQELDFENNKAVGKFVHNGMLRGKSQTPFIV